MWSRDSLHSTISGIYISQPVNVHNFSFSLVCASFAAACTFYIYIHVHIRSYHHYHCIVSFSIRKWIKRFRHVQLRFVAIWNEPIFSTINWPSTGPIRKPFTKYSATFFYYCVCVCVPLSFRSNMEDRFFSSSAKTRFDFDWLNWNRRLVFVVLCLYCETNGYTSGF